MKHRKLEFSKSRVYLGVDVIVEIHTPDLFAHRYHNDVV